MNSNRNKIQEADILGALKFVVPNKFKSMFFMSRISMFGHRLPWPIHETGTKLFNIIDNFIGPDRTLILPSYTDSFGATQIFDIIKSEPETGAIPQAALESGKMTRSPLPMSSCLIRGPSTEELLALGSSTTASKDSLIGWLVKNNIPICAIGLPETNMGWILVHYAEERLQVPYRYFKKIVGTFYLNGVKQGNCSEIHFVHSLKTKPIYDWSTINKELDKNGLINKSPDKRLPMKLAHARDIINICENLLKNDPYCLVKNRNEVIDWVRNRKYDEIKNLSQKEFIE